MSVLVVSVSVLIAVVLVTFQGRLTEVTVLRERARIAADAAALAAVAESAPHGTGQPRAAAERLASANGGSLVDCMCEAGATAMQVAVRIGSVTARARAEIDPALAAPASAWFSGRGLTPEMEAAVSRLLLATGGRVAVTSGWRDPHEQRLLWAEALRRYGSAEAADDWVARPGTSAHERGTAVDLAGDLDLAVRTVAELGLPLVRPLAHEPWHFEYGVATSGP